MNPVIIGDCQLYHGDCREILPTLAPGSVDAVVTDPPYVFAHVDGGGFTGHKFYSGGSLDGLDSFNLSEYADVLANASNQIVAFHSRDQVLSYAEFCTKRFGKYDLHFWHKVNAIPFTHNTWKSDIEYIALGWRAKNHQPVHQSVKGKAYVSGMCTDDFHPTAKPVPLMAKYVSVLVATGGVVCDPFMGSGTTGVACVRQRRKFIGIEIDAKYFDIACRRIDAESRQGILEGCV